MTLLVAAAQGVGSGLTAEVVLFWLFAVLALGSALAVITLRNIVHGALMLVLNFLAIAGLYLTLESAFLSIIQVLVYAGAIMVLFLFVIMLLGVQNDDLFLATQVRTRVAAATGGALLAGAVLFAFVGPYTSEASICGADRSGADPASVACAGLADAYDADDAAGVAFLGQRMFTRFTYPFELSALLLTVATIGAVILARRRDLEPEDEDEDDAVAGTPPIDPAGVDEQAGVGTGVGGATPSGSDVTVEREG